MRKFICRKPKWKIRLKISHRTCSIRDPTNFELSELNWRACQLTCSLNIHHKHIRHYHLLSIASFLSTRFIKDLHQTLTSVRCPHRLTRTYLHQKFTFTQTLTYTHALTHAPTYLHKHFKDVHTNTYLHTHTFQHIHSPTHTSSYIYLTKKIASAALRVGGRNKFHIHCNFESILKDLL